MAGIDDLGRDCGILVKVRSDYWGKIRNLMCRFGEMTLTGQHLFVATPCYGGQVTVQFISSMLKLQAACHARGIGFTPRFLSGDALISRARNLLVEQFLTHPDATHLLFIDADIGFLPDQVFRLLDANKDIAGAAYPLKAMNSDRLAQAIREGKNAAAALDYVVGYQNPNAIMPENGFAQADYIGTGFLMIARPVFMRFAARYPEAAYRSLHARQQFAEPDFGRFAYFDVMIDPETRVYLSEDFTFCKRWRAMGGEIWVDLASRLTHVGPTEFHGDLSASFTIVS